MSIICFIPARSGSKRIPHKNIRKLAGHPLMAYTIAVALDSGIFDKVYVVSDSREYLNIAWEYGALCIGEDGQKDWTKSRDYDWMKAVADVGYLKPADYWMILRPTSPFKTIRTIKTAWNQFNKHGKNCSVRAIKRNPNHPFKSWKVVYFDDFPGFYQMLPFIPQSYHGAPRFECQTQSLGPVWIQSATLEIGHTSILETGNLSDDRTVPYFCRDHEGVDINTEEDWFYCEFLIEKGLAKLPEVRKI